LQNKSTDPQAYKTERSAVAVLMHWMRNIIIEKNIDLGMPDVDTTGADRKSPDIVIYENPRSKKVLCVIEAKRPSFNVYNEDELINPAKTKANKRKAKYFGTTNFKKLIWFDAFKVNANLPEEEQIIDIIDLSAIDNLNDIEKSRYKEPIKRNITQFLQKLYEVSTGKKSTPKLPIDERLVQRLHEIIRVLSDDYSEIIYEKYYGDKTFKKDIKKWFREQNWNFAPQPKEFDKIARQTAYLLINKILFYELLQVKRPKELDPLDIPETLKMGSSLRSLLESRFKHVFKEIDYETIFTTDFIDIIAFPDSIKVVNEIKTFMNILRRYNFGKLGYDIIGRIFERLIPTEERHKMGQYFTKSEVVDLILNFCLIHEDDDLLDPSCGAGTFLKRAYQHKKLMNNRITHEKNISTLWGNDIAKFPATLATINLAISDLAIDKNYPNIIQEDFFALMVENDGINLEKWRKKRAKTLSKEKHEITYPRFFKAIIGNPPYTRQEEIPETGVKKSKLIEDALNFEDKPIAKISKRAGIYAYFFVHGTKFLIEDGYFGFIVSNSWLDVDYGKGLQEFFLENYKIITIIESKVERWFKDADINTCIVILQKCSNKKERENNLVRFAYLKKPLSEFIPPAGESWDEEINRRNCIDQLKNTILAQNKFYENDDLRIYPISQKKLWNEGFDKEEDKYIGAKWGKYLRAPEIFFKILKKCKNKLVPLKEVANIRRGFTTGANEFFYLTEDEIKRRKIEKEFWMHKDKKGNWVPNYVIVRPNELNQIKFDGSDLKHRILIIEKTKKNIHRKRVYSYIKYGEKSKFNERPTCSSRKTAKQWYNLDENIDFPIAFPERVRKRYIVFYNHNRVFLNKNLYGIEPKNKSLSKTISLLLNSTFYALLLEITSRQPGGGGGPLDIDVEIAKNLQIPDNKMLIKYRKKINRTLDDKREIKNIFKELGASSPGSLTLENVLPDRRALDKIIMGDILGLNDNEQLEVYKAVVDLVKSRIEKAKSVQNNDKIDGIDVKSFSKSTLDNIRKSD